MENNEPGSKTTAFVLSTPIAIVIAGAFIAAAIYASGTGVGRSTEKKTTVNTNTTVSTPVPTVATPTEITFADITSEDHARGAENAKITLLEYSDLECSFCRRFHPTVAQLLEEFPNDLRVVYRHFPLEAIHPQARASANASECAAAQGKFWEYVDYIFANTTTGADLVESKLLEYGRAVGIANQAAFTTCVQEGTYDDKVMQQAADAQAAGARGTPYSILVGPNGEKVPVNGSQPFESVKTQITNILNG